MSRLPCKPCTERVILILPFFLPFQRFAVVAISESYTRVYSVSSHFRQMTGHSFLGSMVIGWTFNYLADMAGIGEEWGLMVALDGGVWTVHHVSPIPTPKPSTHVREWYEEMPRPSRNATVPCDYAGVIAPTVSKCRLIASAVMPNPTVLTIGWVLLLLSTKRFFLNIAPLIVSICETAKYIFIPK